MASRVLLYRSGALGDTLLAVGALDALRRRYPEAAITLAARPAYAAPLLDAGRTDALLDAEGGPFRLLYETSPEEDDLARLLRSFEATVFFTQDLGGEAARRLASLGAGRHLLAPPFPPEGEKLHVAQWMVRALVPLGVDPEPSPPAPLIPSVKSRAEAATLLERLGLGEGAFLALHLGGGGRAKWAPPGAIARIARAHCARAAARPLLIQGPADEEACATFLKKWGEALPVARAPRAEVLAALLAQAAAFIGGDSGVSHLAALCGAPALTLLGPASAPGRWAPLGARAGWLPWDRAAEGAERLASLAARPL